MKRILIIGSGGLAREVYFHLKEAKDIGFIAFFNDLIDETRLYINGHDIPVINKTETILNLNFSGFYTGVSNPIVKKKLSSKLNFYGLSPLPTFVHSKAIVQDSSIDLGHGGIVCPGAILTTNIKLGNSVILNFGCTVGHDTVIEDFVTINPNASISGNVVLGEGTLIGTCAAVLEKLHIAPWTTIGAGAVVSKPVLDHHTVLVGIPARPLVKK